MARGLHMAAGKLSSEESPSATLVLWPKAPGCFVGNLAKSDRPTIYIFFSFRDQVSSTNIIENAQHSDLRGELLSPAHEPDML
jgi:hypothetical protein